MAVGAHKTSKVVIFQDSVLASPLSSDGMRADEQQGEDQLTSFKNSDSYEMCPCLRTTYWICCT